MDKLLMILGFLVVVLEFIYRLVETIAKQQEAEEWSTTHH